MFSVGHAFRGERNRWEFAVDVVPRRLGGDHVASATWPGHQSVQLHCIAPRGSQRPMVDSVRMEMERSSVLRPYLQEICSSYSI